MATPRILAFSGSLRAGSWNKKLIAEAAAAARAAGAEVTTIDLRDLALPLFDEDLEKAGAPAGVTKLKAMMMASDGYLIASPEYNSSVTAALKNAIDWASRPAPGETSLACFQDRVAGIMAASTGALGGLRGLVHLRAILGNIGVLVLPQQVAVMKAHEAFDAEGRLKDEKVRASVTRVAESVVRTIAKLKA
jgi:chromate reductase